MSSHSSISSANNSKPVLFRPADIILAIGLIVIGFAMSFFLAFGQEDGAQVTATVAGKLYGTYDLSKDQLVTIRQEKAVNTFEIKDGKVHMAKANCHSQDCIHEGIISKSGETIVCLPHKIVLEITGGEEEFDAVAE